MTHSKHVPTILQSIDFVQKSQELDQIDITGYVNFAWGQSADAQLSAEARKQALKIFSVTDILIIIGYSFPNFNKDIDNQLFELLKNRPIQIIYQDPNAGGEFLSNLITIGTKSTIIKCMKDKMDIFFLPYDFQ